MVRSGLEEPVASGGGDNAVPRCLSTASPRTSAPRSRSTWACSPLRSPSRRTGASRAMVRGAGCASDVGRCAAQPARAPLQGARRDRCGARFLTALSGTSIPLRVLSSVRGSENGPRCVRLWARRGRGRVAQSLREPDDGAVRSLRARDDDVSRNCAALRVKPARCCARGAPPLAVRATAALGISTLLYLVPVPLAATHQAGSVALLLDVLHVLLALRRPAATARAWRQANLAREAGAKARVTA